MVATVHSDPYAIFMRKIGYSVGLEHTLQRIADLETMYLEKRDVTTASWKELIHSKHYWNLKTDNIADVFYSLRYIHETPGDLLVVENLDTTGIASSLCEKNENAKRRARELIFAISLIQNDGEIFLNTLRAEFETEKIKRLLTRLIEYKRRMLFDVFTAKDARKKVMQIVNIKHQESNKGSAGQGKTIESITRTKPLAEEAYRAEEADSESVTFSEDYFRKVPPRRRDWAKSIGLWSDETGITKKGHAFMGSLENSGMCIEDGIFVIWPLDYELVRSNFRPDLLLKTSTYWDFVTMIAAAFGDVRVTSFQSGDPDQMVELLSGMLNVYRSLHTRKAMLRRELPLTIAYPAAAALAYANGTNLIDFPAALKSEQHSDVRRVSIRRSRNTGGALSVKP